MNKLRLLSFLILACTSAMAQLTLEFSFGTMGTGPGQFSIVFDVAVAPNGNVYVSDVSNKIIVFDPSGNFLFQFGSTGALSGQFNYPKNLAVDSNGNVFVLDYQNTRVQKFDGQGNFITTFSWGNFWGTDIDVDRASGNIYVSTAFRIFQYSNSGTLIQSFTTPLGSATPLNNVSALAVINSKLYVSDMQQQHIFNLDGSYVSAIHLLDNELVYDFIASPYQNFFCSSYNSITAGTLYDFDTNNNLQGWTSGSYGIEPNVPTAAVSPFNNKLYYLSRSTNQVRVFNVVQDINLKTASNSLMNGATYFFDNVMLSSTGPAVVFNVENRGWGGSLGLTGTPKVLISGPQASSFQLSASLPSTVSPGGAASFTITFQPTQHGSNKATLTILSNDPDEGNYVINLSGFGANSASEMPMNVNTWLSGRVLASQIAWQVKSDNDSYNVKDSYLSPWSNWTTAQKNDLQKAFSHAFNWFYLDASLPDAIPTIPLNVNPNVNSSNYYAETDISVEDAWQLYVTWVAHNLFLEAYNILPWSITSTDDESKKLLLNSSRMMFRQLTSCKLVYSDAYSTYRRNMTGASTISSPIYTYKFLASNNIINSNSTRRSVIEKLLAWCNNSNMYHFLGASSYDNTYYYWQYRGGASVQKIIEGTVPQNPAFAPWNFFGHWTAGCHGTGGFLRNVLRAVNIPVELSIMAGGHNIPLFRTEYAFLTHGDNPYDAIFRDSKLPTSSLLVPGDFFDDYFGIDFSSALNNISSTQSYMDIVPRPVNGYVGTDAGSMLPGAQLTFINTQTSFEFPQQTSYTVQTDAHGFYNVAMMPGTYNVTVTRPGATTIQAQIMLNNWPQTFMFPTSLKCPPPTNLQLTELTINTATLAWTDPIATNNYEVVIQDSNNGWSQITTSTNTVTFPVFDVLGYTVTVMNFCGSIASLPSSPLHFTSGNEGPPIESARISGDPSKTKANQKSDREETGITIYPNPVSDVLTISSGAEGTMRITNAIGQEIYNGNAANQIDTQSWLSGTYILQLFSADGKNTRFRVIKK